MKQDSFYSHIALIILREYGTKIDMGLAEIMTPSDVHLGGLGMPRLLGPEHARRALVARLRVRNYLITYYPQLVVAHESFYATQRGAGGDLKNEIAVVGRRPERL
jgi:hypothetical protein